MKLAEALQQRADLSTRINQLKVRLNNNAVVQEGSEPAEDPAQLMAELDACYAELESLITRINLTNSRAKVSGVTLTALLARRDCLKGRLAALQAFRDSASELGQRYTKTEIRLLSTVNVRELQKTIDAASAEFRKLDTLIQAANWSTELK